MMSAKMAKGYKMLNLPDIIVKQIQDLDKLIKSTKQAIQENYKHPHTKSMEFVLVQGLEQREKLSKLNTNDKTNGNR